jgi:hypothetical protein
MHCRVLNFERSTLTPAITPKTGSKAHQPGCWELQADSGKGTNRAML